MARPPGVAIIGAGKAGHQHAEAAASAGFRVVAYVDPDPSAEITEVPRAAMPEVLVDPAVDAVAFCVPPAMRHDDVRLACCAGKHVLVEKPPATSSAALDALLQAIPSSRIPLVMLQNRVLLADAPSVPTLRAARGFVRVSRPRPPAHWTGWRADATISGGGGLAHLGIHYVDLAAQFLGEVTSVVVHHRDEVAPGVDLSVSATARFASGSSLDISMTTQERTSLQQIHLDAANGSVAMKDGHLRWETATTSHVARPRSAAELRVEVYRMLLSRVSGAPPPERQLLSSTRGTQRLLDLVYGASSGEERHASPDGSLLQHAAAGDGG